MSRPGSSNTECSTAKSFREAQADRARLDDVIKGKAWLIADTEQTAPVESIVEIERDIPVVITYASAQIRSGVRPQGISRGRIETKRGKSVSDITHCSSGKNFEAPRESEFLLQRKVARKTRRHGYP